AERMGLRHAASGRLAPLDQQRPGVLPGFELEQERDRVALAGDPLRADEADVVILRRATTAAAAARAPDAQLVRCTARLLRGGRRRQRAEKLSDEVSGLALREREAGIDPVHERRDGPRELDLAVA